MKTNATISQLEKAMKILQTDYDYPNVNFENIEKISKNRVRFTLRAKSKERGARISWSGRNLPKASWHVHGHLFDILFSIDENIFIDSLGKRITKNEGNWEDRNIGSIMQPMYFSESSIE